VAIEEELRAGLVVAVADLAHFTRFFLQRVVVFAL
jgi:hypothetical protein